MLRSLRLLNSGALCAMNHNTLPRSALRHRTIQWATRSGNTVTFRDSRGSTTGTATTLGNQTTYRDGIMLTAVAPLPMTTSLLSV